MNGYRIFLGVICVISSGLQSAQKQQSTVIIKRGSSVSSEKVALEDYLDQLSGELRVLQAVKAVGVCEGDYTINIFKKWIDKQQKKAINVAYPVDGASPLSLAIFNNNLKVARALIDRGAEVAHVDKNGYSALMIAAQNNREDAVELLLASKSLINQRNNVGTTALAIAVEMGYPSLVRRFIQKGARVNIANNSGVTPLMIASSKGFVAIVTELLAAGADPNLVDDRGSSSLMYAVQGFENSKEIIQLLLSAYAWKNCKDKNGFSALKIAIHKKNKDAVETLLEAGAIIDGDVLFDALEFGNQEIVDLLLQKGADCNYVAPDGWTALMNAARNGNCAIVEKLLQLHADVNRVNQYGASALILASPYGHLEIVKLLVDAGAESELLCDDPTIKEGRLKALDYAIQAKQDHVIQVFKELFYKKAKLFYCEKELHKRLENDTLTEGDAGKNEPECPICLEEFVTPPIILHATLGSDNKTVVQHHKFCIGCVENILKEKTTRCPLCRGGFICPWGLQKMVDWHKELDRKAYNEVLKLGVECQKDCSRDEFTDKTVLFPQLAEAAADDSGILTETTF